MPPNTYNIIYRPIEHVGNLVIKRSLLCFLSSAKRCRRGVAAAMGTSCLATMQEGRSPPLRALRPRIPPSHRGMQRGRLEVGVDDQRERHALESSLIVARHVAWRRGPNSLPSRPADGWILPLAFTRALNGVTDSFARKSSDVFVQRT